MARRPPLPRLTPRNVLIALILLAAGAGGGYFTRQDTGSDGPEGTRHSGSAVAQAFAARRSDQWMEVSGRVERRLSDDREGSRHQRFILDVGDGLTVLVAHNIDLAPRVPLQTGDEVELRGEYEWNDKGGVIHWTHHDPQGRHRGGWIRHRDKTYR